MGCRMQGNIGGDLTRLRSANCGRAFRSERPGRRPGRERLPKLVKIEDIQQSVLHGVSIIRDPSYFGPLLVYAVNGASSLKEQAFRRLVLDCPPDGAADVAPK
jgi:hypothetical protein